MRWLFCLILLSVGVSGEALAQQPSPLERVLSEKLLQEINSSVQCSAALITAQERLRDAEKEKAK